MSPEEYLSAEEMEKGQDYIADRIKVDPRSGCWIWQRALSGGYGRMRWGSDFWLAHRFSFFYFVGFLHKAEVVHHRCGERSCVNPDHLQLVSSAANSAEMMGRTYLLEEIEVLRQENLTLRAELEAARSALTELEWSA